MNIFGSVGDYHELMAAATGWVMAANDLPVLSLRMEMRFNCLILHNKFSMRWHALNRALSNGRLSRRFLRWGMTSQTPCARRASAIRWTSNALSAGSPQIRRFKKGHNPDRIVMLAGDKRKADQIAQDVSHDDDPGGPSRYTTWRDRRTVD